MTGRDNWFEDFVSRCIAEGIDPDGLLLSAGYDDREIKTYRRGRDVSPTDQVLLESALLEWGTEPEDDEEDEPEETAEAPAPDPTDPPLICDGDKIRCPYLTLTGRKGFCMMPRCIYGRDVNDQTRADAGQEPAG